MIVGLSMRSCAAGTLDRVEDAKMRKSKPHYSIASTK